MMPTPLSHADLNEVVRLTPLVSIDLVIRDPGDRVLLGLRTNEPAKGVYFVPGGRIWKDERFADAFARILKTETGYVSTIAQARLIGVYEHFYKTNRFNDPSYGTHYVALGYELRIGTSLPLITDAQHSEYLWWTEAALLESDKVHENTKAYFR
jgi:colanic acid biosynthesis protein WcaH